MFKVFIVGQCGITPDTKLSVITNILGSLAADSMVFAAQLAFHGLLPKIFELANWTDVACRANTAETV